MTYPDAFEGAQTERDWMDRQDFEVRLVFVSGLVAQPVTLDSSQLTVYQKERNMPLRRESC